MARKKVAFMRWFIVGMMMFSGNAKAMEIATIKSVQLIDSAGSGYEVMIQQDEQLRSVRVDKETTVVARVPASKVAKGDRIWINQNVREVKGLNASIHLSPSSSRWFGIPQVNRVAAVNAFQKVPEKNTDQAATGMIDGVNIGIETVQSVQLSRKGVTLVMRGGIKKRFFLQGARLWKTVSPSALKPNTKVKLNFGSGNKLKHLLVDSL